MTFTEKQAAVEARLKSIRTSAAATKITRTEKSLLELTDIERYKSTTQTHLAMAQLALDEAATSLSLLTLMLNNIRIDLTERWCREQEKELLSD